MTKPLNRRALILVSAALPLAGCAQAPSAPPAWSARPESLTGRWVYRSFINSADSADDFGKLRLAVALIEISPFGGSDFKGSITTERWQLSIAGQLHSDGRFNFRASQGSSNTAGWIYDYVGWVAPKWEPAAEHKTALEQVPTLVGTMLRVLDHDNLRGGLSKGGQTYSFIAVRQA